MELILAVGQSIVDNAPYLIGFLMPMVVQVLNQKVYNEKEKFLVTIISCGLAAVILNWHAITYGSPHDVLISAVFIFAESQAVFKLYFKNSWLQQKINEKIAPEPAESEIVEAPSNP